MRERTVKVGSAGKMFSLTGWKVGLVVAAPELLRVVSKAHQFLTFTTPPNLQAAVAFGLMKDAAYFTQMRNMFQKSRDRLTDGLRSLGFDVIPSQGTYFDFCKRLVVDHKVAAIPVSAFYAENPVKNVIRLCFAKKDETLDEGLARLARAIGKR
jgi:aspartate/methionine/tyrosine aminotransferase